MTEKQLGAIVMMSLVAVFLWVNRPASKAYNGTDIAPITVDYLGDAEIENNQRFERTYITNYKPVVHGERDRSTNNVLFTTTETIPGSHITKFFGEIFAKYAIATPSLAATIGRSLELERNIKLAEEALKRDLADRVIRMGANAVVGLDFDMSTYGGTSTGGRFIMVATGTVVDVDNNIIPSNTVRAVQRSSVAPAEGRRR